MRAQPRFDVIDRSRIVRGRRPGRRIEWPVSLRTQGKFYDLLGELVELETLPWDPSLEDRRAALQEDIRALPGFPKRFHPEDDTICPVVTTAMR
jgi:hypothetical protein